MSNVVRIKPAVNDVYVFDTRKWMVRQVSFTDVQIEDESGNEVSMPMNHFARYLRNREFRPLCQELTTSAQVLQFNNSKKRVA